MANSRLNPSDYANLAIFDPEPFAPWVGGQSFEKCRISDFVAAMLVPESIASVPVTKYHKRAPRFFNPNQGDVIKNTGNMRHIGRPFVYKNSYVTFGNYRFKGTCALLLTPIYDIRILSEEDEFKEWAARVRSGVYEKFTWALLEKHPNLLHSVTTPGLPGSIGSSSPPGPAPYFGVSPNVFAGLAPPGDVTIGTPPPVNITPSQPPPQAGGASPPNRVDVGGVLSKVISSCVTTFHIILRQAIAQLCEAAEAEAEIGSRETARAMIAEIRALVEPRLGAAIERINSRPE